MLECVINISSADSNVVTEIARAAEDCLLDVSSDRFHNRSVITLAGPLVEDAARAIARRTLELVDLSTHVGVHPRIGVLDVVPFAPITNTDEPDLTESIHARDAFARFAADALELPCFIYGPERTLPEIRRRAFRDLAPDYGPTAPHRSGGASCVGARAQLVAYNIVLDEDDVELARRIALRIRSREIRALGLLLGTEAQVSCNLVRPFALGPRELYETVRELAPIRRCELVGLIPESVFQRVPEGERTQLDLEATRTIEARCAAIGIRT